MKKLKKLSLKKEIEREAEALEKEDKEDTSIDEILTMFNEISIECGN